MNKKIVGLLLAFFSITAYAAITTDILTLGFGGLERARIWVSTNGRIGMQSHIANDSTAIDLWPTSNTKPLEHSISEITLQRKIWGGDGLERFNISAMVDASKNGAYRFGVERSGTGIHRDIIFCFEDVTPGVAICPFKVTMSGVFVNDNLSGGDSWKKL